jgi:hypothetical protein
MMKNSIKKVLRLLGYEIRKIPKGEIVKSKKSERLLFNFIYKNNMWGGKKGELYSGPGSDDSITSEYIDCIKNFIAENNVKTIVDIGCGDFRVGKRLVNDNISYIGLDVSDYLIKTNNKKYKSSNVVFVQANAITSELPKGDLCLIRQVLQHLSNDQIVKILKNITKYKYVLITEHLPLNCDAIPNINIENSWDTRISINSGVFIDKEPFNIKSKILLEIDPKHPGLPNTVIRTSLIEK